MSRLAVTSTPTPDSAAPPAAAPVLDRFLTKADLRETTGLARGQIREMVLRGEFPAPVLLTSGGRKFAWLASEVAQWQRDRTSHRVKWQRTGVNPAEQRKAKAARKGRRGP